jgi:hypothetical protein
LRLSITSLRKGQAVLEQALESGEPVHLPSESGWICIWPEGPHWLAAEPPEHAPSWSHIFWPGPLRLRLASQRREGPKEVWHIPAHPLVQAFLKLSGPRRGGPEGPREGLWLEWKEPPLQMRCSEVDWATTPARWICTGSLPRQEVEWAAGCTFLLSGAALPSTTELPAGPQLTPPNWRIDP